MLSKNQIKLIKSLNQKKIRQELGLFTVEGVKGVREFLGSAYELQSLFATDLVFDNAGVDATPINEIELKKISALKNPNKVLGVFKIPLVKPPPVSGLVIALDDVRDPGNLGTIIRLCDWFGVTDIICSETTVDCYNSKVVQASMGSLARIQIHYLNLGAYIKTQSLTVFGTDMIGESVYETTLPSEGIIVLGNEANGISEAIKSSIDRKLMIPQFGTQRNTESLNVANATAIILSEFKRRTIET